ncbi:MAG: dipeptidase PepE [Flavobacteriales bacterium]|nr:dipeptidase PepE [Flavobacteriales bacterium]
MNLLLLSNSTNYGEPYLNHAKTIIDQFVQGNKKILFVPYAGVTISYDEYTQKVRTTLAEFGIEVVGIHTLENKVEAIQNADVIAVGGGNTFRLLQMLYDLELIEPIKKAVKHGAIYIGWSAGSNIAGKTICTTNDMPIVEPKSFNALNLIPFQINPHYSEKTIPNHGGESRMDRLKEFILLSKTEVICLPEGSYLEMNNIGLSYVGNEDMKIYQHPNNIKTFNEKQANQYLMEMQKNTLI